MAAKFGLKTGGVLIMIAGLAMLGWKAKTGDLPGVRPDGSLKLPNGWTVSKVGKLIDLPGDFPQDVAFLADGRHALVNTAGFNDHTLNLINLESGTVGQTITVPTAWIGLDAQNESEILLSAGQPKSGEMIHRFALDGGKLVSKEPWLDTSIPANDRFVSSIVRTKDRIYVLNIQTDELITLDSGWNPVQKNRLRYRPYALALSPNGEHIAVSNWGDKSVSIYDTKTMSMTRYAEVGPLPSSIQYAKDGRLFVSVSGADYVAVIDGTKPVSKVNIGFGLAQSVGSSPVALSISRDESRLYVANAGNNSVAVVDLTKATPNLIGHIPTDRYPTLVKETPDGKRLIIGTAKGEYGPNAGSKVDTTVKGVRGQQYNIPYRYISTMLKGRLTLLDVPTTQELKAYTQSAREGALARKREADELLMKQKSAMDAMKSIKHVIYVIRENRTYDQVFGDMKQGNGDPSLCLFGEDVTPNSHQLAKDFILFDNFYADGECSQCGHQWTDAAFANDYCEKQWVLGYSRRSQIRSDLRLTSSPGEYIWTQARKQGLKARVYGEYVDVQEDHDSLNSAEIKADPERYGYSATWERIFARGGRDTEKIDDFLREFKEAERTGELPNLMVMALPDDHTHGFSPGTYSPKAMVADNDLALGRLVDAVSHSKFWKETAIFVIQDDAQDGPDHVDAHRTVAHFISPYTRRGVVDSMHYTTSSMLRTMGLILGTAPLSQYDAIAPPMIMAASSKPDLQPFKVIEPKYNVNEKNPESGKLAEWSKTLDFSEIDRADFDSLNRLLWAGYKPGVQYPAHFATAK
ncbi:MAG: bifunctional YncE family protein/alkaline phosphatase family protein [Armatimonadota bacterium]